MTREQFWALVEQTLRDAEAVPDPRRGLLRRRVPRRPGQRHVVALERRLAALDDDGLVAFQAHLDTLRSQACTWDLWGAGALVLGGLGDDGFTDLRTWLVSQGPAAVRRVLADPEALGELAPPDLDERLGDAETWGYVALELWDARHDDDMPRPAAPTSDAPAGTPWQETDLPTRFPRLAARPTR